MLAVLPFTQNVSTLPGRPIIDDILDPEPFVPNGDGQGSSRLSGLERGDTTYSHGTVDRTYYYDRCGRVAQLAERNHLGGVSRTSWRYDWAGNVLECVERHSTSAGSSSEDVKRSRFTYDARGRVLSEEVQVNGGETAYVGNALSGLVSSDGTCRSFSHDSNGNMTFDGLRGLTIGYNCLNLPETTSESGMLKAMYSYCSDGSKVQAADSLGAGHAYLGSMVYGLDLGVQDFGARFYDSRLCRWTTQDPLAEKYPDLSPYAYCGGDPVGRVDPGGEVRPRSEAALNVIRNTLPLEAREYVQLNSDGLIMPLHILLEKITLI